jgi:hypothetical protein
MSYVPPTLEGRVLVDLGQQLTAMRARAEQAEADNARLREALDGIASPLHIDGADHMAAVQHARAALAGTPEKRGTKATA